jgi:phospholipid/cholesterol/gamma-HCH transport system permease protein
MFVIEPLFSRFPRTFRSSGLEARRAAAPRLERLEADGRVTCQLRGAWIAVELAAPAVWPGLAASLHDLTQAPQPLRWDLRQLARLDHVGAQLLWMHWGREWPAELSTDEAQHRLLKTVERFSQPPPARPAPSWPQRIDRLGAWLLKALDHALGLVRLTGQLLLDLLRLLRRPRAGPWRDVSGHLYHAGASAVPITALVGFLIGVVLAYLMSRQLRQFGADAYIVNILGVSLIRELGPLLAAILMAGRSGSAMTAQIGTMRVTEELDAMRVLGIASGFRLVMPRALALAAAMPLISTWTTLWSLLGGMLASDLTMGVSPGFFISALPGAVQVSNLALATGKSVVFGLLIALFACHYGLRVKPNTESLGEGTTASVVTSITVVILVDALFAVLFRSVGL